MCAMEFKQELEYWDINPDLIGDCCWNQYRPFLLPHRDHAPSPDPDGCRGTMWKILQLKHSGRISKITKYFVYGVGLPVSIFFKLLANYKQIWLPKPMGFLVSIIVEVHMNRIALWIVSMCIASNDFAHSKELLISEDTNQRLQRKEKDFVNL